MDLVERSGVSKKTIVDFERGASRPYQRTLVALEEAFKAASVEFIPRGVRLRSTQIRKLKRNETGR
jgi:transcriptional regulator with XRE-family HTH domain